MKPSRLKLEFVAPPFGDITTELPCPDSITEFMHQWSESIRSWPTGLDHGGRSYRLTLERRQMLIDEFGEDWLNVERVLESNRIDPSSIYPVAISELEPGDSSDVVALNIEFGYRKV